MKRALGVLAVAVLGCQARPAPTTIANQPPGTPAVPDGGVDAAVLPREDSPGRCAIACCRDDQRDPAPDGTVECCFCDP